MTTYGQLIQSIREMRISTVENALPKEDRQPKRTRDEATTCIHCGEQFNSQYELTRHQWANLWEAHYIRYRGDYLCKFCKASFKTLEEYREHWDIEKWHENYAAAKFFDNNQQRKRTSKWLIQPTEGARLKRRLRNDPKLRKAYYQASARDIVIDQIQHPITHRGMTISETYGISNSGKSAFIISLIYDQFLPRSREKLAQDWLQDEENHAAAMVHHAERKAAGEGDSLIQATIDLMKQLGVWREPRVYFTFSVAHTLRILRKAKAHDHIVQDEDEGLVGKGKDTTIKKLRSTLKQFRAKCVNFHFISPDKVPYVVNTNLMFETSYMEFPLEKRVTRAMVLDADGVALGWMQLPILPADHIPTDVTLHDLKLVREAILREFVPEEVAIEILAGQVITLPIMIIYEILKHDHLESAQQRGGVDSFSFTAQEMKAEAERVADLLIKDWTKKRANSFTKERIQQLIPSCHVVNQGDYQNLVADEAHYILQNRALDDQIAESGGTEKQEKTPKLAPTVDGLSLNDLDYLDTIEHQWAQDPKRSAKVKWIDKYRQWVEGGRLANRKEIAGWLGLTSGGNVSNRFQEITGAIAKLQGDQFERVMWGLYSDESAIEVMIPNRPGPQPKDTPDSLMFLRDGSVRICSWKCVPSNPTIPIQGPEMKKAREMIENGARVKLFLEGITGFKNKQGDVDHMFFSVELDPYSEESTRTIFRKECQSFPPDMNKLLLGAKKK